MAALVGQTVSHYKILEHLGGGGMGVAHKDEGSKLTRIVHPEFLPAGLDTHEGERARFLARAAATLNHPTICAIHGNAELVPDDVTVVMNQKHAREGTPHGLRRSMPTRSFNVRRGKVGFAPAHRPHPLITSSARNIGRSTPVASISVVALCCQLEVK